MRQITVLSHTDALRVLDKAREILEAGGHGAAVAVVDSHGELIAFLKTDGCPLPSIHNAIHKAFTAARERKESGALGQASREEGFPLTNFGDLRYTGWGGGVPLYADGRVIGAVGVSGLPEAQDVEIARAAAGAL
jgi:glc operon protein GlcG